MVGARASTLHVAFATVLCIAGLVEELPQTEQVNLSMFLLFTYKVRSSS